jgi:hypothetical protein
MAKAVSIVDRFVQKELMLRPVSLWDGDISKLNLIFAEASATNVPWDTLVM